MATSAPNPTPDPRPTGDLEHLFRQKFADAEVAPRADLWEQLDHELLIEQNNTFRRRLSVHRWVAAACLLLLLSASGWAVLRQWQAPSPDLAARRHTGATRSAAVAARTQSSATETEAMDSEAGSRKRTGVADSGLASAAPAQLPAENGLAAAQDARGAVALQNTENAGSLVAHDQVVAGPLTGAARRRGAGLFRADEAARADESAEAGRAGRRYAAASPAVAIALAAGYSPSAAAGGLGCNGLTPRFALVRGGWLAARPDTLKASLQTVPQPALGALAAAQDQNQTASKQWRRWRLGGSYAAMAYNPNINFSPNDGQLPTDVVTKALSNYYQDDAETEYRRNLRAGLGQRIALTAAYALDKRWTLTSGAEAAEQRATSATSYGFVDGRQVSRQVADLFSNTGFQPSAVAVAPTSTRKTAFRYRTLAVPVEIRYGSTTPGTTFYAKVGAAVGLLLGSRSELENSPEATRTYSLSSTDSPYRQVQTSVRGGAGVRFQPANAGWSLALGATTEMGLTTLNANPSQRVLNQSRPYSVGLEASMEFGSKPAPMVP